MTTAAVPPPSEVTLVELLELLELVDLMHRGRAAELARRYAAEREREQRHDEDDGDPAAAVFSRRLVDAPGPDGLAFADDPFELLADIELHEGQRYSGPLPPTSLKPGWVQRLASATGIYDPSGTSSPPACPAAEPPCECVEVGPLLVAPGTSGRSWTCDTCGRTWTGQ